MKSIYLLVIVLTLLLPFNPAFSKESQELRKQRQSAQKERQQNKNDRAAELREATQSFREFARDLKTDYKTKLKELDTDFELKQVELRADRDTKIAESEAEYQRKLTSLFMRPGTQFDEAAMQNLQTEGQAYADELFGARKEFDKRFHLERMANEQRKADLLEQQDRTAMDEAGNLGLTKTYTPILATPIGDSLTKQEESWNARERKEVAKIETQNAKVLTEFVNGAALRAWEMKNLEADFNLTCDEKRERHALDSQQLFYNAIFMQAAQGGKVDQQELMARVSELSKETKLIMIKYKKIRDQNRIKRREQRKKILGR